MSLDMIEADCSRLDARRVADALVNWISANLEQPLGIATLAAPIGESKRSFCRRVAAEVAESPAHYVETVRLGAARRVLERGAAAKVAARAGGFTSAEQLSRAFSRGLDLSPQRHPKQTTFGCTVNTQRTRPSPRTDSHALHAVFGVPR